MSIKILGVSGSPRKAATEYAVSEALKAAAEFGGVETELISLRGKTIHFCIHCNRCIRENVSYCPQFDDDMTAFYPKFIEAQGIILGSPVYQMATTAQLMAFMNRLRPLGKMVLTGESSTKVGGAIAVGGTRHGGQETTLDVINNMFFSTGMIVVSGGIFAYNGGSVWSNGKKEDGAKEDETGMETVRFLGRRVAVVTKLIAEGMKTAALEGCNYAGFLSQAELDNRIARFKTE